VRTGSGNSVDDLPQSKENTISASNRVDAAHVGGGTVDNAEFGRLDGVTSDIQTQFNGQQLNVVQLQTQLNGTAATIPKPNRATRVRLWRGL
jgi:hypothetical protein